MRAFIDLYLNYAPHEIIYSIELWVWPHFLQLVVHQVGLKLVLVVHDNGDILMVRTQLSVNSGYLSLHPG